MRIMILGLRGIPAVEGGIERHVESLSPLLAEMGCDVEVVSRRRYRGRMGNGDWRGVHRTWIWSPKHSALETIVHTFLGVVYAIVKRPDVLHLAWHRTGAVDALRPHVRLACYRYAPRIRLRQGKVGSLPAIHAQARRTCWCQVQQPYDRRLRGDSEIHSGAVRCEHHRRPQWRLHTEVRGFTRSLFRFGLTPRRYILQVSRFVPEKRQLDLLRAFAAARLEGWKLVLVGRGEGLDRYSSEVRHLAAGNPMVVLTGFQTGAPLHELYGNAAGFVLPSSHEGLPIALLEALSYGLPTLASDIPANLEVASPSGRYFPLGDLEQLTEGLRDLYRQNWTRESADQSACVGGGALRLAPNRQSDGGCLQRFRAHTCQADNGFRRLGKSALNAESFCNTR
jgi:glycosyltransferase involved in cell wall biosynthesis